MREATLRTVYFSAIIAAIVLFGLMLWDFSQTDGDLLGLILIGFGVVILVLLSLLFFLGRATPEARLAPHLDYPGDIHDVVDLEGIGDTYAGRLHAAGIANTQELLFADPADMARTTGASPKTVARWRAMAELIKVNGIGPQYAEILARIDVAGIDDLKTRQARSLAVKLNAYLDSLDSIVVGKRPREKRVRGWIQTAKQMERVPIDLDDLHVRPLESKAARASAA